MTRKEAARIDALRAATEVGWKDIDEGRYQDIEPAELESYIHSLGARPSEGGS